MTPEEYATAVNKLDLCELSEADLPELINCAVARLRSAQLPDAFSDILVMYWGEHVEQRKRMAEAETIGRAAARFRQAIEGSEMWRDYLQLPDAGAWSFAGAWPPPANGISLPLAKYLEWLEAYMRERSTDIERKTSLTRYVIRGVADRALQKPYADDLETTSGQQRWGRNVEIAKACSALLAREIDRQDVADALRTM